MRSTCSRASSTASRRRTGWVQTFEFLGAPGYVSLDTLQLVDLGGRTLIRTTSLHQSVEARDAMVEHGMADGMADGYSRLDELVASLQA